MIRAMTPDEITQRITALQDEMNKLIAMLPEDVQISFGTLFHTTPTDVVRHKKLVVSVSQAPRQ